MPSELRFLICVLKAPGREAVWSANGHLNVDSIGEWTVIVVVINIGGTSPTWQEPHTWLVLRLLVTNFA